MDSIADWLRPRIDAEVVVRDRFAEVHDPDGTLASAFADARVLSPYQQSTGSHMRGILEYEQRALAHPERAGGVLYDGYALQQAFNATLPANERSLANAHIVFLDRTVGTWGSHDGRWHKRIAVLGHPAILSVTGLAEAPAKPEAYYQEQQRYAMLGRDPPPREYLEESLDLEILIKNDPRTTEAMCGYALKAYDYLATGDDFCADPACRLSNPHRHGGVIRAQIRDPPFCDRHASRYGE